MKLYECQDCGGLWREEQIKTVGVAVDEPSPFPRCPECGGCCHRDSRDRRFDVHIFALVRFTVRNIKADDHEAAIAYAVGRANIESRCRQPRDDDEHAGEISHYLVDVCGDNDYGQSREFIDGAHRRFILWGDGAGVYPAVGHR